MLYHGHIVSFKSLSLYVIFIYQKKKCNTCLESTLVINASMNFTNFMPVSMKNFLLPIKNFFAMMVYFGFSYVSIYDFITDDPMYLYTKNVTLNEIVY